ncbi:hypothetical protein H206_05305 [Candidatus Electrothrix aarhusensis]|uniref:Uncharacterized protein n=1 Tax=Candidatus Electrothrix aarhusensis TaxID=1859131 RepID=A0A444J4Y2_9BACT|nr:hypothetical protein H206_05305 [Candidatus Electrothrix aarhusensis]
MTPSTGLSLRRESRKNFLSSAVTEHSALTLLTSSGKRRNPDFCPLSDISNISWILFC